MKRKTSLVILGTVLTALLGLSLTVTQRSQALSFDCEMDRFNAFMAANDTYTSTFRSWYFGDPVSCVTQCTNQCDQLPEPQRSQCLNDISTCVSNCDSSRFGSFTSAQDGLISAANQTCTYNPDFCAEARYLRDQCVSTYNLQMENPVLDENQEIDGTWWAVAVTEYFSCRAASGIDQCE